MTRSRNAYVDAKDEGFENANVGVLVRNRGRSEGCRMGEYSWVLEYISFVKLHLQPCYRMCVGVGVADRERLGESRNPGEAGGGGVEQAQSLMRGRRSVSAPILSVYQCGRSSSVADVCLRLCFGR
jgi:hypothetical protein